MQRILRKSGAALVAAIVISATFGAASALAHVQLISSSPRSGATVKAPSAVTLTFSGPLRSGAVRVVGPRGKLASKGSGGRDPRNIKRLAVSLQRGLKAGTYRVSASIVAGDGHRESFSYAFRIKK